ncbi:MAG: hypothetical protein PVF91_09260 [Chromatiales bacterium]|jgi:hypothetical protein
MALPLRGDPGLTFVGFLLLAALGAVYWKAAPLESARPETAATRDYGEAPTDAGRVKARLWQDPFKAAFTRGGDTGDRAATPAVRDCTCDDSALASDIDQARSAGERVLLLPVLTWPGAHAEVEERRRRARYSVLSALTESGLAPRDSESLRVCDGGRLGAVPYEWYDREFTPASAQPALDALGLKGIGDRVPDAVAVLWVNDARLGDRPLEALHQLFGPLNAGADPGGEVPLAIIGPARSGTLRKMVREAVRSEPPDLGQCFASSGKPVLILSPNATVSSEEIIEDVRRGKKGADFPESTRPASLPSVAGAVAGQGVGFLRTIRDDQTLLEALVDELGRRDIDIDAHDGESDHVVVISEWDTYYGRSLPRALAQRICRREACPQLHQYSYQRGIDGIVPGERDGTDRRPRESGSAGGHDALAELTGSPNVRRAAGTGRYDYLRRLSERIRELNRRLRLDEGRSVRAVFILGSDVYDKLLILKALRAQLPGTLWLTTDYDALLFHPGDFRWTRNLVIASTYGSSLPPGLQDRTPPFRSGYQTSTYLATRLAVDAGLLEQVVSAGGDGLDPLDDSAQKRLKERLPARLFEVGRWGPVPLGVGGAAGEDNSGAPINSVPGSRGESALAAAVGIFVVALLGLFALHQLRPGSGPLLVWMGLLFLLLILLTVAALLSGPRGEPLLFSAGVSVWPTEYIRVLILMLGAAFVGMSVRQLDENARRIDADYFGGPAVVPRRPLGLLDVFDRVCTARRPKLPVWVKLCLAAAVVVIALPMVLGGLHVPVLAKIGLLTAFWALVIGTWWRWIYGRRVEIQSVNAWAQDPSQQRDVGTLWRNYSKLGAVEHWFLRAVSYVLLYMAFASIVFTLLGTTAPPCRGELACHLDRALLGLSVLTTLFLLFVAVDAIRLCLCWIELMGAPDVEWSGLPEGGQVPFEHQKLLYKVQLIGDRTAAVSKLVYYPVLIILLMLLAKSTYFDDWGFPQALAVVVGLNFLIAFVSAVRLNQVAERIRDRILDQLQKQQLRLVATGNGRSEQPEESPAEIGELIGQIRGLQVGAFRKPWDQPIVRATLLLLGGVGISYSEYANFF